jgi:RNA polymerase sigma-70 factor (ECF subfamily)
VDKEQFANLVITYQQNMYRLALGILRNEKDAEDALSETIIKAYEHLAGLRDEDKFKSWIMTILINVSKNMLSKNRRLLLVEDVTVTGEAVEENQNDVWRCVMELGEQHRRIIILYYYDGFSTKEIARILKVPEGTVKSRLGRARQHF